MNQEKLLHFLYETPIGRIILKPATLPVVSRLAGKYLDSSLSRHHIKGFIKSNGIDMSQFEDCDYPTFNSFFTRRLKPSARHFSGEKGAFICPCDSRLSAYEITSDDPCFFIKGAPYSVSTLLGGDPVAKEFAGGSMLVFRLQKDDYHRYCFFDSGRIIQKPVHIKGVFHTVNPISLGKYNFFHQNSREYTVLQTDSFGKAVYCEIGAMLVGRIVNYPTESFKAGEEKGYFEFGGSTVAILIDKNRKINGRFYENTAAGIETRVYIGENLN